MMTPDEFALWMAGAMEVFGEDKVPTPEAWKRMYTKMSEVVGQIGAQRILDEAKRNPYQAYPNYPPHSGAVGYVGQGTAADTSRYDVSKLLAPTAVKN